MQIVLGALIGLISGITSGLFGVGGGLVMVPAMVVLMKLDFKMAVGTSLLVIIPTAISGTLKHAHSGFINWKVAAILAPTAIIGSAYGAALLKDWHGDTVKRAFGVLIILMGGRLLLGK
jgi:uncharacterized protein